MIILLRLKHWQLFLLILVIPLILNVLYTIFAVSISNLLLDFSIMLLIGGVSMAIFFGWLYVLGTNLHKMLPETVSMNLTKFKLFLITPLVYISFVSVLIFMLFNDISTPNKPMSIGWFWLIIPIHLFSMFCIFYCLYFTAKVLKSVELQKSVSFGDFVTEFFLLWFYPIGIWIIQPRVNKFFEKSNTLSTDPLV